MWKEFKKENVSIVVNVKKLSKIEKRFGENIYKLRTN
jgi:hypothetical protein